MRIGTNPIGNYSPVYKKTAVSNTVKTNSVAQTAKTAVAEPTSALNKTEKAFFSKMYPENTAKIMDHHFYMKNGNMSGVTVGSLFDRRG